ncbi:Chemotaxis signal transduction protein [Gloeomargarita lithophora Alchichica-D10]|uniref:Chemotaxis signal transduction protein n=1 Tax=Gloeomargarita lithophora Alchichica-D10 TaxID=1188229 RepID=A0A1J0ADQ3_9CYAN|nr:chemotaxis protein CheW [Gloeomargarita lithophora]APB34039.1 Chemotaxis signal transduction protein [Gloeomargarita lithophora Alchichica-D10]
MPATTADELLCLSFQLSPTLPALLPAHECLEVLPIPTQQIVAIPDMPPAVMGVANWRGEVLWLLDLAHWLGFGSLLELFPNQLNHNVLILAQDKQRLGLVVAQVGQMFRCPLAQLQSPPGTEMTPALAQCLRGYWAQEPVFLVLDGQGIVQSLSSN